MNRQKNKTELRWGKLATEALVNRQKDETKRLFTEKTFVLDPKNLSWKADRGMIEMYKFYSKSGGIKRRLNELGRSKLHTVVCDSSYYTLSLDKVLEFCKSNIPKSEAVTGFKFVGKDIELGLSIMSLNLSFIGKLYIYIEKKNLSITTSSFDS